MSEDLIERLRARVGIWAQHDDMLTSDSRLFKNAADALAAKDTALSEWKASHARVVEGFMEVCEAVDVQFDAPEAVAYAINAKISNAEHDKRAAESALSEMRVELERVKKALHSLCDADAAYCGNTIQILCDSHGEAIQRMRLARAALADGDAK